MPLAAGLDLESRLAGGLAGQAAQVGGELTGGMNVAMNALPAVMDMPSVAGLELESWLAAGLAGGLSGRKAQAGS